MRSGVAEEAEPLTRKFVRASDVSQDASWTPKDDGPEVLLGGVFFVENVPGKGIRVVKGVTTFTKQENDALNEESQVTNFKRIQKRIREFLDARYAGRKALVATIQGIKQDIVVALEQERSERQTITDSILADGTVERAFTDPVVSFTGGRVEYSYGIKLVGAINFLTGTQFLEPVVITV